MSRKEKDVQGAVKTVNVIDLIARLQGKAKSYRDRAALDRTEAARLMRQADANEGAAAAVQVELEQFLHPEEPEPVVEAELPETGEEAAPSPEPATTRKE